MVIIHKQVTYFRVYLFIFICESWYLHRKRRTKLYTRSKEKEINDGSNKRIWLHDGMSVNSINKTNISECRNLIKARNGDCYFIRTNCRAYDYRDED